MRWRPLIHWSLIFVCCRRQTFRNSLIGIPSEESIEVLDRMMRRPIWGQGDGAQNTVRHIKTSGELANFVSRLGGEGNSKKGRAAHPGTPPSAAVCLWLMCELWRRGRLLGWMKGGQGREISQFDKQKKKTENDRETDEKGGRTPTPGTPGQAVDAASSDGNPSYPRLRSSGERD